MIAATAALSSCLPNTRANAKDWGDPSCNGLEEATLSARTTSSAVHLVMALGTWPQVLLGKLVPSALPHILSWQMVTGIVEVLLGSSRDVCVRACVRVGGLLTRPSC